MTAPTATAPPLVRFGPKGADFAGRLVRVVPGRLVIETTHRFAAHTTLHVELDTDGDTVRARGVVERLAPLGPWPERTATGVAERVALTVVVFSGDVGFDALVARLSSRDERRRHRRFDERLRASLGTPSALGVARVCNVGLGGAYVEHPAAPPVGASVSFRLHLPDDGPPSRVVSTVVHVVDAPRAASMHTSPGIGVAFCDLAPVDAQRLQAFVDRLAELDT